MLMSEGMHSSPNTSQELSCIALHLVSDRKWLRKMLPSSTEVASSNQQTARRNHQALPDSQC